MTPLHSPTRLLGVAGLNFALRQSLRRISAFLLNKMIFSGVNEASTDTSAMLCDLKDTVGTDRWTDGQVQVC